MTANVFKGNTSWCLEVKNGVGRIIHFESGFKTESAAWQRAREIIYGDIDA